LLLTANGSTLEGCFFIYKINKIKIHKLNILRKEVNKMLKKLIVTGAAAGLLLVSAAGAFASENHHHQSLPTVNFNLSNTGSVTNTVDTSANTGYNVLSGGSVKGSGITTGAASAGSNVQTQLNFNQFDCGCVLGLNGNQNLNFTLGNSGLVYNTVGTSANTGFNSLTGTGSHSRGDEGHRGGSNGVSNSWITTGAAAASSVVSNVVNTNIFGSVTP
jgi:hypothetical protein